MNNYCDINNDPAEAFIAKWESNKGGAERANYALFLTELCDVLDVPKPDPAEASSEHNDYVFERAVIFNEAGNRAGYGRIDLYKRGCFILEAKQSRLKGKKKEIIGQHQDELFESDKRGRRGAERGWDVLMMNARKQAENYAQALPAMHDWPPFILICDVGHVIEVFADFTGKGRNYTQFPDRQGFRIYLEDLRQPKIRERLKKIWTTPQDLDPGKITAKATRDIAKRLAALSKLLEERNFPPEDVANFLMRCLFTMFAEDVKLLPEKSFTDLLKKCIDKPDSFSKAVGQLWEAMNTGGYAHALMENVRRFNGEFFKNTIALPLNREEIGELFEAAKADWRSVEPAIFGTLLEQALSVVERKNLGAHYTPRPYVERLVVPTIIEPLREDWRNVLTTAEKLKSEVKPEEAARVVRDFHHKLCQTRVLDPACGTGNFLYIALELMKRLEGEVLEALVNLGGQEALALDHETVDPHQFLGIELNTRGASIAELVLWIGYLQWHYRNHGEHPGEPILRAFRNVLCHDALLDWEGYPVTAIKNGATSYLNAKKYEWPQAEFIVGNPPFIGGKDMRTRLGGDYVETLWRVYKEMNDSADFVMYWWDRAADLLTRKGTALRRFGFVTTNSITQDFQRRTVERYLSAKKPVSLLMAIANHPWTKATKDAAAVRIAMTVAAAGMQNGILHEVKKESGLDTDEPEIELTNRTGKINADLSIGTNLSNALELKANAGLCSRGVQLMGAGFIVTPNEAAHFGLGRREGLEKHIRHYRNGKDITGRSRGAMVIDLFGLSPETIRERFPEVYQHLMSTVRVQRQAQFDKSPTKDAKDYLEKWWQFGKPRTELRPALSGLKRYIATVETAKHRVFQFLNVDILPDNKILAIASEDPLTLAVLVSRIHETWYLGNAGKLGVYERNAVYVKSKCFDPFPFPDSVADDIKEKIRAAAEELDATRKMVLKEHPEMTITGLYNSLEKLKAGEEWETEEKDVRDRGRVLILKELHDTIDALVFDAYGWSPDLTDEQILERLVALNRERVEEEHSGHVRWLRPEYQIPKFGAPGVQPRQMEAALKVEGQVAGKPAFPKSEIERTAAVFSALLAQQSAVDAGTLATTFSQGRKVEKQVRATLMALARMGHLATHDSGQTFMLSKVG